MLITIIFKNHIIVIAWKPVAENYKNKKLFDGASEKAKISHVIYLEHLQKNTLAYLAPVKTVNDFKTIGYTLNFYDAYDCVLCCFRVEGNLQNETIWIGHNAGVTADYSHYDL